MLTDTIYNKETGLAEVVPFKWSRHLHLGSDALVHNKRTVIGYLKQFGHMRGCDLDSVNLEGACIPGCDLSNLPLFRANFTGADLKGVNLSNAKASYSDFQGADLEGADLRGADFRNADFSGANLSYTKLEGADFSGADLSHAKIKYKSYKERQAIDESMTDSGLSFAYRKYVIFINLMYI